jgi:hypothetical protein
MLPGDTMTLQNADACEAAVYGTTQQLYALLSGLLELAETGGAVGLAAGWSGNSAGAGALRRRLPCPVVPPQAEVRVRVDTAVLAAASASCYEARGASCFHQCVTQGPGAWSLQPPALPSGTVKLDMYSVLLLLVGKQRVGPTYVLSCCLLLVRDVLPRSLE